MTPLKGCFTPGRGLGWVTNPARDLGGEWRGPSAGEESRAGPWSSGKNRRASLNQQRLDPLLIDCGPKSGQKPMKQTPQNHTLVFPTPSSGACLALVGASVLFLTGCRGGLSGIDSRTQALLRERSEALGGGAIAPERTFGNASGTSGDIRSKKLSTVNPGAEEMRFNPVDEARQVEAKLDEYSESPPNEGTRKLGLEDAFRAAQRTGREYLSAEEDYILAAIRLLIERHQWSPRLFNDTSTTVSGGGDDGMFNSAVRVVNDLRVTQKLPFGGQAEARWVWRATEQLRDAATGRYRQSSELSLDASVPLLRGAGLVAQESLIQAERDLIYQARTFEDFRRSYLVGVARDYFELVQAQAQIENQVQQLRSLRQTAAAESARYDAGRVAEFRKNLAANDVLEAQAALAASRERFILQVDRFKIRLGLDPSENIAVGPLDWDVPVPETTLEEATLAALEFRLDLQSRRDQLDDARRAVKNARNGILPNLDLNASVSVPTDPDDPVGGVGYSTEDLNYSAGVTFGLPLDRETERLRLRQSIISLGKRERDYEQARDNVVVTVRQAVRNIDLARFQLKLAEDRVRINERRLEELRLKSDEVDPQTKLDADNALLRSKNARDQAQTDLRNAILSYLLESGQLRVARDGTFQRLPGMDPEPAPDEPMPGDQ